MIILKYLVYILLGILQGFTEPLPISSSGHLVLAKNLFNTNMLDDVNFEIVVNFGSFIAIFLIFWQDIVKLLTAFFGYIFKKEKRKQYQKDFKYCLLIILGSIPVGIAGLLLKDMVDAWSGNMMLLGISFMITAIMLFIVRKSNGKKEDHDITYKDALIIGLMQMCALTPGISRSGTVLVGCLLCSLSRKASLKYTFMLYLPVSVASMGLGVFDLTQSGNLDTLLLPYTLGMLAAGIVTYFSYKWLSKLVQNGKLWKFSIYCFFLSIFVLFYFR